MMTTPFSSKPQAGAPWTAGVARCARWALALAPSLLAACAYFPGIDPAGAPAAPPAQQAAPARKQIPAGIVSVTYDDPARFSEARSNPNESDSARHAWLDALCLHLSERAAAWLPEGQRLEVHLTDVQRAGGFEPWRGPQFADVRIVSSIYPPRIDLRFKLRTVDGRVLREGQRQLRDSSFMMRPDMHPSDPLRYEKALLDDWLQQELALRVDGWRG